MIALDTNVLLYRCDKADPRQARALDLISATSEGVLLWQIQGLAIVNPLA